MPRGGGAGRAVRPLDQNMSYSASPLSARVRTRPARHEPLLIPLLVRLELLWHLMHKEHNCHYKSLIGDLRSHLVVLNRGFDEPRRIEVSRGLYKTALQALALTMISLADLFSVS